MYYTRNDLFSLSRNSFGDVYFIYHYTNILLNQTMKYKFERDSEKNGSFIFTRIN